MTKTKKPTMAIVGSGNLARVLALALKAAGHRVTEIVARDPGRTAALARRTRAHPLALQERPEINADVTWICVTDDAIAEVARILAKSRTDWRGKVLLHTSGAFSSKELAPVRRKGAAVGSAHPMNSFVKTSKPDLRGVPLAIEGDAQAMRAARASAKALSAEVFSISPGAKVLYHTMGAFSSPLLVSLLNVAERIGRQAGLREPRKVMARILQQTVANFIAKGGEAAFSGPIKRGDVKTVSRHLKALGSVRGARTIYEVLATHAVRGLPGKDKVAMLGLLKQR